MVGCNCSICSDELWYLPECCVIARLQILSGLPDIVIVCEEIVPVLFLLLPYGVVVLIRSVFRHLFQVCYGSSRPSLSSGAVSPVCVYTPQLRQVSRPPSLCVWRRFGLRG